MMKTFFALLSSLTLLGSSSLSAQEAWLLQMPKKYGSYLLSKSQAGENETVQDIIAKLPDLVKKNTIKEIESIKWQAPGKLHQANSQYLSQTGVDKTQRSIFIESPKGQDSYKLSIYGELSKSWAPTLVLIRGDQYLILLEKDESAAKETVAQSHTRKIAYKGGNEGELTWYSSTPLNGKSLLFQERQEIVSPDRPTPVRFGTRIVCLLNKEGESSVQLELNSKDAGKPDEIYLHHNQAIFPKLSQLTGPLKKEIISLKEKGATDAGEEGSWTLTIEGE